MRSNHNPLRSLSGAADSDNYIKFKRVYDTLWLWEAATHHAN